VNALLAHLTPGELDEWMAWRRIEPDPYKRLLEVLKMGFAAVCAAQGYAIEPAKLDPYADPDEGAITDANQAAATFRRMGRRRG